MSILLVFSLVLLSFVTIVTLSTNKLLGRIVAPDLTVKEESTAGEIAYQLHSQTYGLASDALAGTAILFSALIHDGKKYIYIYIYIYSNWPRSPVNTRSPIRIACFVYSRPSRCIERSARQRRSRVGPGIFQQVHCGTKLGSHCLGDTDGRQVPRSPPGTVWHRGRLDALSADPRQHGVGNGYF